MKIQSETFLTDKHCSSVQKLGIEQRINLIPKHDPLQLEQISFRSATQESFISLQLLLEKKIHELFMNWQKSAMFTQKLQTLLHAMILTIKGS